MRSQFRPGILSRIEPDGEGEDIRGREYSIVSCRFQGEGQGYTGEMPAEVMASATCWR
jgi:hypothetical protein